MRNRTMTGLLVAGAATVAAVVGGVAYATADDGNSSGEPVVRIVTEQDDPAVGNAAQPGTEQPREDCPEKDGQAPSTGTGL